MQWIAHPWIVCGSHMNPMGVSSRVYLKKCLLKQKDLEQLLGQNKPVLDPKWIEPRSSSRFGFLEFRFFWIWISFSWQSSKLGFLVAKTWTLLFAKSHGSSEIPSPNKPVQETSTERQVLHSFSVSGISRSNQDRVLNGIRFLFLYKTIFLRFARGRYCGVKV